MKMLRLFALSTLLLGAAQAASITHNSSAATNFAPGTLVFSPDIPLFNPALGTLTSVLIEFDATFGGDFSFQNAGNSDGTISGSADAEFQLIGPAPLPSPLLLLSPSVSFSGPVSANSTRNIIGAVASQSDSYSSSTAAVLAAFTGVGNVAFGGTATQTGSPVLNFSPGFYSQTVSGQANLAVTYTYREPGPPNEVPEPATWAFVAGGGLMLLAKARGRRSQQ